MVLTFASFDQSRPGTSSKLDILAKAALSHLELALVNLGEHESRLSSEDRATVASASARLCESMKKAPGTSPPELRFDEVVETDLCSPRDSDQLDDRNSCASVLSEEVALPAVLQEDDVKAFTHDLQSGAPKSALPISNGHDTAAMQLQQARHSCRAVFNITADGATSTDAIDGSAVVPASSELTYGHVLEPWQEQLMEIFTDLDLDGSGDIRNYELRRALQELSISPAKSMRVLKLIDIDQDGRIDRGEWETMVVDLGIAGKEMPDYVREFASALSKQKGKNGRLYAHHDVAACRCVLIHNSNLRIGWDVLTSLLLGYIALSLPFTIGYQRYMEDDLVNALTTIETALDCFFMFDVLLNLRTSFINVEGAHITDGRAMAMNYLKSWFLIDILSSFPFDVLSSALPNLQAMKLLKFGKIAKALKFLRLGRLMKRIEIGGRLDEFITRCTPMMKLVTLIFVTTVLCHWLACFMSAAGGFTHNNLGSGIWSRYLAGLYWAMTTMATVGYGDIIPGSDMERAYTVFSMIVGCGFYGYVLGSITSVVTTIDANMRAYHERMRLVNAWLDHHQELPVHLMRRIRRYFKEYLTQKTALDDSVILNDLSPELRVDVSHFMVNDDVRFNTLFEGLPAQAFSSLVPILQTMHAVANERIVRLNEPGVAMFIIIQGTASMVWGHSKAWEGGTPTTTTSKTLTVGVGDSFGEEIILGLEEHYLYTVTATDKMTIYMIQEDMFKETFQSMPFIVTQMKDNFLRNGGAKNFDLEDGERRVKGKSDKGEDKLLEEVKAMKGLLKQLLKESRSPSKS